MILFFAVFLCVHAVFLRECILDENILGTCVNSFGIGWNAAWLIYNLVK